MSKITHEQAKERKQNIITKQIALSSDIYSVRLIPISADETNIKEIQDFIDKQSKLLKLYKEFFDKLNIQLRNTFDIDYIYPHEFIIGYDIKSEDKELVKLFKQIKEIENE